MKALTPIDISLPIDDSLVLYPGDPRPSVHRLSSIANGDALTASELRIHCHAGTHVDAPAHFLKEGASVTQLPLAHFQGPARVLDLSEETALDADAIRAHRLRPQSHVLLKTRNSALLSDSVYREEYAYLTVQAAEVLMEFDPLSIGFDYYSLDRPHDEDFPVHKAIARRGLPVFVCLDLRKIDPGDYYFTAFPLNIPGLEGIPVRAVLFSERPRSRLDLP